MGVLLHLLTCFACLQTILSHPLQDVGGPLYDDVRMHFDKRDAFYPFKESLLSSLGLLQNSGEGLQSQRKKAVDSTFIRFGRSSPSESKPRTILNTPENLVDEPDSSSDVSKIPQRFILNHNGCQISNSKELFRVLMSDRNCMKAFKKVKRENVNDTFIRFGKRSVPSEEQRFESQNSGEV